jgi:integrase
MPWQEVSACITHLRDVSARCLEFVILTAARSGEALRSKRDGIIMGARWEEIDFAKKIWTVHAVRMKAGEEHRVPLCEGALAILEEMGRAGRDGFTFSGERRDETLSETVLARRSRYLQRHERWDRMVRVRWGPERMGDTNGHASGFRRRIAQSYSDSA